VQIVGTSIWSDVEVYEPCGACGRSERTIVGWWLGDTRHLAAAGEVLDDLVERHIGNRMIRRDDDSCSQCHYPRLAS
jgi:hypothetical protein